MTTLLQDLRYAVRMLRKTPAVTVVALLALALGIGGASAVFSVINTVLLRPLSYPNTDRIYKIYSRDSVGDWWGMSPANYLDIVSQQHVFSAVAAVNGWQANLSSEATPERVVGAQASASLFPVFGLSPVAGRVFSTAEEQPGHDHVVLLGYKLWQRGFAGDREVIGRTLRLNEEPYTVIGIMPPTPTLEYDFWVPSPWGGVPEHPLLPSKDPRPYRDRDYFDTFALLAPAVAPQQAITELGTIAKRLEHQYPKDDQNLGFKLSSLRDDAVGDLRPILMILLGAIASVLLIACANVANLLLARAAARQKEIAVRTALGASRSRIMRQLLTESVLLSIVAGAIGVVLAIWVTPMLLAMAPPDIQQFGAATVDVRVLSFALVISTLTGILFGLAPGWRASKFNLQNALKEGGRTTDESRGSNRTRRLLIAAEVAVSLVLLAGTGLLLRSFIRLLRVDPGFDPANLAIFMITPPGTASQDRQTAMHQEILERLRAVPGVTAAGAVSRLPLSRSGNSTRTITIPGHNDAVGSDLRVCTTGYFQAIKLPLLRGRDFSDADRKGAARVAIVNQQFVRQVFPNEEPLGRSFSIGGGPEGGPMQIVGVIGNEHYSGLEYAPRPEIYLPLAQTFWFSMTYAVRSANSDPMALSSSLERAVWSVDRDLPLAHLAAMEQVIADGELRRRFTVTLLAIFAAIALLLAAFGLYSVMSYIVSQRTREFGLRMALGAQPADVLRMVLGHGLRLVLIGLGCGLVVALAGSRLMAKLLFGVKPSDPPTFIAIVLLLGGVALLASYVPARKATRVDPMIALRDE